MKEIEIKNAVIESASISYEDHGVLTAYLGLDYGGVHQSFGGYGLYLPKSFKHHNIMSVAGHFIFRSMEVAGVTRWKDIVSKTIRVKSDWGKVYAIGHIVKDDWFCPEDDFKGVSGKESV